ncbi:MBL fold metallo-hydrolase [Ohtaekwangia sp.]|uniref:MBL fold metallo-hydrolase n=1 Tax=Ohtaekwangia sp. TaxID=2066019 RepID=UPI002FDDD045
MKKIILSFTLLLVLFRVSTSQNLPKASVVLAAQTKNFKIYTFVSPNEMFAVTSHVIELPSQLIVVDGQFFAPYAQQLKSFTDSLNKPITRFYISHDHPDHYLGFGDAFPHVEVYALKETKEGIEKEGQETLVKRQQQFGAIIAQSLRTPSHIQKEGRETIEGVTFLFEKSLDNEAQVSLIIKIPEAKAYIAQDIVYNHTHLFIHGHTTGWRKALKDIQKDSQYTLILPGHGKPTDRSVIQEDLKYLDAVDKALAESKSKQEYKSRLQAAYPDYAGVQLMDIYLNYYLKKDWAVK